MSATTKAEAKKRLQATGGDRKSGKENFPDPIQDTGQARDKAGQRTQATGAQIQQRARQWLQSEIERCRKALGPSWSLHQAWVLDYLHAELRERIARWRA